MLTVYLVRENSEEKHYLTFVSDDEDSIIPETAFRTDRYSEALLSSSILFKLFSSIDSYNPKNIASYIESPFESVHIISYSEGEFCVKKTSEYQLYSQLIDHYHTLLASVSPTEALQVIKRQYSLTADQRIKLAHFLRLKPTS